MPAFLYGEIITESTQTAYAICHPIREKERPEYSVHIQKPLFDNHKDRRRFLALKRVSCARFDLFPNIDSIACKRVFYVETDLAGNVLARH